MSAAPRPGKTVGILGGMGPEATVDLMQRVIRLTPARGDEDHLRMLVDNNPAVPSRIEALIEGTGPSPAPTLVTMGQGLAAQGADFLAMPCNTAHHYHREVAEALPIPFLNMVDIAARHLAAAQPGLRRVGLLASSALRKIELYEPWLAQHGLALVYPGALVQGALMDLIRAIKRADAGPEARAAFPAAARDLEAAGAEALLIACTELSVIAADLRSELPVYDSADLLARAIVATARDS